MIKCSSFMQPSVHMHQHYVANSTVYIFEELAMTFHRLRNTNVRDGISKVIELCNALFECIFLQVNKKTNEHIGLQRVGRQMSLNIL